MKAFKLLNKITDSNNALKEIACNVLFNVREKVEEASKSDIYNVYDLSAEIQIYPLDDKILLRFFGNDRLEQILLNEEDIEEYHYQNQCDRPEDISEEEWNDREKNWETVNPTLVPAKRGFGVQLFYENDLPFMLDEVFTKMDVSILKHSLEKRTKLMAEQCYQYPKFTGNNWNVFMEPEYKEFIKEKSEEFRQPLINAGDPIEKLYQIYTK